MGSRSNGTRSARPSSNSGSSAQVVSGSSVNSVRITSKVDEAFKMKKLASASSVGGSVSEIKSAIKEFYDETQRANREGSAWVHNHASELTTEEFYVKTAQNQFANSQKYKDFVKALKKKYGALTEEALRSLFPRRK